MISNKTHFVPLFTSELIYIRTWQYKQANYIISMITLSRVPQMKGFPQIIKQKPLQNCNDTCSHFAAWLPSCTTSCSTQFTSLWQGFRTLFVWGQSNQCQIKVILNILNEEKLIQQLSYDYKTIHTQTEMQQQKNCEVKLHNSFSIGGVDITRHANSPGRTQNEHFSERNALSTQNSIKTSKKITVTWRIMTAGPLENKRGEPSLVEKKIHEE